MSRALSLAGFQVTSIGRFWVTAEGRDNGEAYNDFLTRLAKESGIDTPTRQDLAKRDRERPKKGSNQDWEHPHDPDARITKMKDGRTHLAHKVEHAVDMKTGAVLAVTVQGADQGDTTTIRDTTTEAARQLERVAADYQLQLRGNYFTELVTDKGYHSNDTMTAFRDLGIRTYASEPNRGRRNWKTKPNEKAAVYANRRRIRGERSKRLLRQRGLMLERPFAHALETGGLRRVHLRRRENILKRVLIQYAALNLSLLLRMDFGKGTPRGLQDRCAADVMLFMLLCSDHESPSYRR